MTTYLLHGGKTRIDSVENKKFFFEMIKNSTNILCVYFSRDSDDWEKLFEQDKTKFLSANTNKNLTIILADRKQEVFIEQMKQADTIYFRGGKTDQLQTVLEPIVDLKKIFQNKVIAGSSAGAYVLSQYYYTNEKQRIQPGLGILPIKTFCHYREDQWDILKKLENYNELLPTYAIPEGEFVRITL